MGEVVDQDGARGVGRHGVGVGSGEGGSPVLPVGAGDGRAVAALVADAARHAPPDAPVLATAGAGRVGPPRAWRCVFEPFRTIAVSLPVASAVAEGVPV